MADITMCLNKDCKVAKRCYRMQATPNMFGQSYQKYKLDRKWSCFIPCGRREQFNRLEKS